MNLLWWIKNFFKDQSGQMGAQDKPLESHNLPLNGKLRTAVDGTQLGEGDFKKLKNMRYGELSPKSISGMTKINSTIMDATYYKPRSGFHFRKSQPSESHLLIQAWNTGLTASQVLQNKTAIPTTGNFEGTELWSDTSGAGTGRFSDAPDNCMVYANGKDTCVWAGDEYRVAGFVVGDLSETMNVDYTDKINNTLDDANNIAVLTNATPQPVDSNTMLMLHMNGANGSTTFTDSSPTTPHTMTPAGNAQIKTDQSKFGGASGYFDGSADYLTTPVDADFDFSGGDWTIDFWVRLDSATVSTVRKIYLEYADANNFIDLFFRMGLSNFDFEFHIDTANVYTVTLVTGYVIPPNTWTHIEVVENGNNYYAFINGTLSASAISANRPLNSYTNIAIGTDFGEVNCFKGYIDEFRVSNVARHTSNFTPSIAAYGGGGVTYVYIASVRPIQGIKWYIKTPNATSATVAISYWAAAWTDIGTITDNTSVGGKTLSQNGTMTFGSTVSTAKPRVIHNVYAYWYLVILTGIDTTTSVYYVTLDAPFQQIVDLWDGIPRTVAQCYKYTTTYSDETTHVLSQDYVAADTTSFMSIGALTSSQYLLVGFAERIAGIRIIFGGGAVNTNAAIATIYYWSGSDFISVGVINDGTLNSGASFGKDGIITWDAPSEASEFKNSITGGELWYYYKIMFDATLSSTVYVDMITGIPAQKTILGYKCPVMWQDRIWLLNEASRGKNWALCSAQSTVCVFNGTDSTTLSFGGSDEIKGGATQFTRFGGTLYDNLIILKIGEVWLIDGTDPSNFRTYKIADNYGLVASATLKSCDMGFEIVPGLLKHVLIWQAEGAVVMFDGNAVNPISGDIENYFDRTKPECIPDAMKDKSEGSYDFSKYEYHWKFASGASATTLNKEFVYDLRRKKWYEIDRTSGKRLSIAVPVRDTSGNFYLYGGIDTGYIERLDYGTTFDGSSIVSEFQTGDIAFHGWTHETKIRYIRHLAISKSDTNNSVTMTHYGDRINSSSQEVSFSLNDGNHGVSKPIRSVDWGDNIFHSFECSLTTDNEDIGYEPLGFAVFWKTTKEALK